MEGEVQRYYGNKIRIRVCGLCIIDEKILLVNHSGITRTNFWSPPGGGLNYEEPAVTCLRREFMEETGLQIEVKDFLFASEFIKTPLHAVELFFRVHPITHQLKTGLDPEPGSPSIIKEVKFKSWPEIDAIPANELHGIFQFAAPPRNVDKLRGFFKL
jgi:8-oxo-dGTP diphosphatase